METLKSFIAGLGCLLPIIVISTIFVGYIFGYEWAEKPAIGLVILTLLGMAYFLGEDMRGKD